MFISIKFRIKNILKFTQSWKIKFIILQTIVYFKVYQNTLRTLWYSEDFSSARVTLHILSRSFSRYQLSLIFNEPNRRPSVSKIKSRIAAKKYGSGVLVKPIKSARFPAESVVSHETITGVPVSRRPCNAAFIIVASKRCVGNGLVNAAVGTIPEYS